MKEEELRENINCGLCNQPFAAAGLPIFHRVTIETYCLDVNAIKRQDGLAAIVGSSVIASVMGPNEDLAKELHEPLKITVCSTCSIEERHCIAQLSEIANRETEEEANESTKRR